MLRFATLIAAFLILAFPASAQDFAPASSIVSTSVAPSPGETETYAPPSTASVVVKSEAKAPAAPIRTRSDVRRALLDAETPDAPQVQSDGGFSRRTWLIVAGGAVLAAGGVLAAVLLTDGDDDSGSSFPGPPGRPPSE